MHSNNVRRRVGSMLGALLLSIQTFGCTPGAPQGVNADPKGQGTKPSPSKDLSAGGLGATRDHQTNAKAGEAKSNAPFAGTGGLDSAPPTSADSESENGDSKPMATGGPDGDPDDGESAASIRGHGFADAEDVGGIRLGMTKDEVVAILGKPSETEAPWEEGATGEWVASMKWKKVGVETTMGGTNASDQSPTVRGVLVTEASLAKTSKGIGVGSTLVEVLAAYGEGRDPNNEGETEHIVIGSLYFGIFLSMENGKVATMYIGRGAE